MLLVLCLLYAGSPNKTFLMFLIINYFIFRSAVGYVTCMYYVCSMLEVLTKPF